MCSSSVRATRQYFAAARKIADHATILPGTGIQFQPHRVGLRGPEQLKAQAQQGLYVWYQQKAAPFLPKDFEECARRITCSPAGSTRISRTPLDQLAKERTPRRLSLELVELAQQHGTEVALPRPDSRCLA